MGVVNLLKSLGGGIDANLLTLGHGRVLGVDASIWLHDFAARHAEDVVLHGDYEAVVAAYISRVGTLMMHGISTVSVFDAPHQAYAPKDATRASRNGARSAAVDELAARADDPTLTVNQRNKLLVRAVRILPALVGAVISGLRARGHAVVVAPFEADAQLAMLAHEGRVDFVVSTDQDMIVHGVCRIIAKADYSTGDCTVFSVSRLPVGPLASDDVRADTAAGLIAPYEPRERQVILRYLAALSGCDYNKFEGIADCGARKLLFAARAAIPIVPGSPLRAPTPAEIVAAHPFPFKVAVPGGAAGATMTLTADAAAARLAACASAFAHAPAFSFWRGKVVPISVLRGEPEVTATAWLAALGVGDLAGVNVGDERARKGRALGHDIAPPLDDSPLSFVLQRPGDAYLVFRVPAVLPGAHIRDLYRYGDGDIEKCTVEQLRFWMAARVRGYSSVVKHDLVAAVRMTAFLEFCALDKEVNVTDPNAPEAGQLYASLFNLGRRPSEETTDGREMRWLDPACVRPPETGAGAAVYLSFSTQPRVFLTCFPVVTKEVILETYRLRGRGDSDMMKPIRQATDAVAQSHELRNLKWCRGAEVEVQGTGGRRRGREDWVVINAPASYANKFYSPSVLVRVEWDAAADGEQLPPGWASRSTATRVIHANCSPECVAGLSGSCWHIAFLLIAVHTLGEAAPLPPGGVAVGDNATPATALACKWSRPVPPSVGTVVQPMASYLRSAASCRRRRSSGATPVASLRAWFSDPALTALLGRQAADVRGDDARAQARDDPARVAARRLFYAAVQRSHSGEACAAQLMYDESAAVVTHWVDVASSRRKRRRDDPGDATIPLPFQPPHFITRSGPRGGDNRGGGGGGGGGGGAGGGASGIAAGEEPAAPAALAVAARVRVYAPPFVQSHPRLKRPAVGALLHCADTRKTVFCWWHGWRTQPRHLTAAGACAWLSTDEGNAELEKFLRKFKVPAPGQSLNDANPGRKGAWRR